MMMIMILVYVFHIWKWFEAELIKRVWVRWIKTFSISTSLWDYAKWEILLYICVCRCRFFCFQYFILVPCFPNWNTCSSRKKVFFYDLIIWFNAEGVAFVYDILFYLTNLDFFSRMPLWVFILFMFIFIFFYSWKNDFVYNKYVCMYNSNVAWNKHFTTFYVFKLYHYALCKHIQVAEPTNLREKC